jgi:cytochrome b561
MTEAITERPAEFARRYTATAADHSPPFSKAAEFDPVIKAAHWLTLFLIIAAFATAFLVDELPRDWKSITVQLHRSFGLAIWMITVLRLLWRQFVSFPEWPSTMSTAMQKAVHSLEQLLYGLLLLQPILGLLYTNAQGRQVNLFFLGHLPTIIGPNDKLSELLIQAHGAVANALLLVIAVHALWAILYHLIGGGRTLNRMLPRH